jgi:D-alanine-D-alanine ligase
MTTKINIAVIFGGRSGEHDVSLMSARSVLSVLDSEKYTVIQIGVTRSGQWFTGQNVLEAFESNSLDQLLPVVLLAEPSEHQLFVRKGNNLEPIQKIDVVFPLIHGTFGEDGTLQGFFELADLAYVGCGVLSSAVGMDKSLFKDVMRANGIPVVESILATRIEINHSMNELIRKIEVSLPYPVFVKPANLGSSVGISKCTSRSELLEGLLEAAQYDRRVLIERGIDAREIEVSVLGNEQPIASTPGEIRPADDFYTYEAKYLDDNSELMIPAKLEDGLAASIKQIALRAFSAIDGAGLARVDFLLDRRTNEIYLSEVNTIPGFTKISMYPKLLQFDGITYKDLVDKLVHLALLRKSDRDQTVRTYRRDE